MLYIHQVAEQLGINPQTLYYYERIGLIPHPERTESGYRFYQNTDLQRLNFILNAKNLGMTLEEIKELLNLQDDGVLSCHQVYERLQQKVKQIDQQISQLQTLKAELIPLLKRCELATNLGQDDSCVIFTESEQKRC
jgi:MerR family transcriptional regulator, Zn(II)-responsive regulator of zntA